MIQTDTKTRSYREEHDYWVKVFLSGRLPTEDKQLLDDRTRKLLRMFAEGNREKRRLLLEQQLSFLTTCLPDLPELLHEYVHDVPFHAGDVGSQDAERGLRWLLRRKELTPEERDAVLCQRARHKVEALARSNRLAHLHFQESWSMAATLAERLEDEDNLRVLLNPTQAWARFHTNLLLQGQAKPPVRVLFFSLNEQIKVVVPSSGDRRMFGELASLGAATLDTWSITSGRQRSELIEFARRWSAEGVLAFK